MSKEQNLKSKFRSSKVWKEHRKKVYHKDGGKDYITGHKLLKGYNCHHLDLRSVNYKKLEDINHFISLNKQTHETVHFLYRYYEKDPTVLDRLKEVLDKMKEYSND